MQFLDAAREQDAEKAKKVEVHRGPKHGGFNEIEKEYIFFYKKKFKIRNYNI